MSSPSNAPVDLLDLKLLPAWVKESPEPASYAQYEGEPDQERPRGHDRRTRERHDRRGKRPKSNPPSQGYGVAGAQQPALNEAQRSRMGPTSKSDREHRRPRAGRDSRTRRELGDRRPQPDRYREPARPPFEIAVRFLPHLRVLESIIGQIKSNTFAYSVFSLARLFLEKPERYDVRLSPSADRSLYRLGENGLISADPQFLENNAFRFAQQDFYKVEVKQSDPIKGNFSAVARCRLSGLLLGPTNHHGYQPKLRSLYEQRFSRRMSFPEYQRQIEIVNDAAVVEQWKEEARNITTFSTLRDENPLTFGSVAEAERHFRQNYLPGLVQNIGETTIDGLTSRQMPDRVLRRLIEDAWARETRSPSQMMQELAKGFREGGLQIFRHRRGMLFVCPIRVRAFAHDQTSVSPQVKAILETLTQYPRASRKELADKLLAGVPGEEVEAHKLGLASDLHWLISEGYVIEFNDGSLDLPRAKPPPAAVSERPEEKTELTPPNKADEKPVEMPGVETIDPIAPERFGEPPLPVENPIAK